MKKIRRLLDEYEIRFNVTDEILEEGYPFDSEIKKMEGFSEIRTYEIWNNNGKVYGYQFRTEKPVWATANVKELPEKWVVEKDEDNSLWKRFKERVNNEIDKTDNCELQYHNKFMQSNNLLDFSGCQFLTLEQWAEFCLPKVDFSILNDEDWFYAEDDDGTPALMNEIIENINILKPKYIYFIEKSELKKVEYYMSKSKINIFRKATKEDLKPLFEKHPELAPPKVGDYGFYYDDIINELDNLKNGDVNIGKIINIDVSGKFIFTISRGSRWKFFHKLDMNKLIQPQIDEFIKIHDK